MPTDPRQFALSRLPWSRWKHAILIDYLQTMAAVLRSYGLIYYVDGFAGPGTYSGDGAKGSPLLAAEHAKELEATNAGYSLKCINVELEPDVFSNLATSTAEYGAFVENLEGDFGDFVPDIMSKTGMQPALFFLDPIGLKGLEWNTFMPIFRRGQTTELLIRFDYQTALRLTGKGKNLHNTFNSILGEKTSGYWQKYLTNCGDGSQARGECLTRAYEDKLVKYFPFVGRIPIKSSDETLKYFLLFATRNAKGMQVMNDVCFKVQGLRDRTLDEEGARPRFRQLDFFEPSPEDKMTNELEALMEAVLSELQDGGSCVRDELRGRVASQGNNLGRFSGSQFTAVLGGRPRGISVPSNFENLKARIKIHNGLTLGNDKVEISLKC